MIKDIKELNFPAYATLETASATIADMGDRTITSQVKIDGDVVPDFSYDWEVEFKGERYIHPVRTPQGTKDNASSKAKIDLVFQHWAIYEMKRQYFVEMASTTAGTAIVDKYIASLGLNLGNFVTAFNLVLNHYFGGRIVIRLNPEWQYDPEAKFVSISYSYIWDVLQQMHEIYGVRWTLKTNTDGVCEILMGYPAEEVSHIFEYGFEGGLLSVQRQVQSTDIRNRLLGRGGSKNLPYRYFKDKDPNNPLFEADPDWIPELANIAFTELRGKTFRDYVRGWKAKRYGGTPMDEPTEAYLAGYNAEKFDPIEYVEDKDSIAKYGVLVGALENNEEIYPSIQGAPGDVDMIVDAEQVTDDDVDSAVENDSVTTNLESGHQTDRNAPANSIITIETATKRYFSVPDGKIGNLDMSLTVTGKKYYGSYEKTSPILKTDTIKVTVYDKLTDTEIKSSGVPVVNIPSGDYYYMVKADIETNCDEESMITLNIESVHLIASTPDKPEGWRPTFDIWVRNIWGSSRNAGETDSQYADRVWLPILGDRMGNEARVVFASGWLSFSSDWEFTIVGYAYDNSKTGSEWRLTLAKSEAELEASGKYIPYEGYNASAGDRFFLIGIDMTHQYVLWGEERVDDYKRDRLPETARINPSWVIKTDKVRLNQDREGSKLINSLSVGSQIRLVSKQFISGAYESLYVQSMTYNWTANTILYPDVEVVVSDKVATVKNPVAQMQGNIEALQRQVGSLSNIQQIIRQVCDQLYLRKDGVEDLSKSPTRFLGKVTGEKFRQGQIGGRDWGIYRDENGKSIAEFDKIIIRELLSVAELEVNHITHMGGTRVMSQAEMECIAVEEETDGYICYFDQKQGSKANLFAVDDIVWSQDFNADNISLKYYKSVVVAVGDNYIKLSKEQYDGEGVPSAGDVLVQAGNVSDINRQAIIIIDSSGNPSITLYRNVRTFALPEPETRLQSGNSLFTGRTVFQSGSSGLENLSEWSGKQSQIDKALEDAKNAASSAALANASVSNLDEKITDVETGVNKSIQEINQKLDGVVESYFDAYTPTRSNLPASEWIADGTEAEHIGDTFTNTALDGDDAGKSWRWLEQEDGTYDWQQIADSDAAKALALAGQAKETADGKSRTFLVKPSNYSKGDLWIVGSDFVPSGYAVGSLLCASASSTTYVASHWSEKVRYTDDTTANEAMTLAGTAKETADDASASASAAQTSADNAQATANEAKANAASASTLAQNAKTAADNAKTAADNAQKDIDYANERLEGWASNGYISPMEQTALKQQLAQVQAEYSQIVADADRYGVTKTSYVSAYNKAVSALEKYSASTSDGSDIAVGTDYANIAAYYTARATILDAIAVEVKEEADKAIEDAESAAEAASSADAKAASAAATASNAKAIAENASSLATQADNNASKAITDATDAKEVAENAENIAGDASALAESAKTVADAAQTAADTAKKEAQDAAADAQEALANASDAKEEAESAASRLDELTADGYISPMEKLSLKNEMAQIDADYDDLTNEVNKYVLVNETELWNAYDNAYDLYRADILSKINTDGSVAVGSLSSLQSSYYSARTNLLNAIYVAAKKLADDAQSAANDAQDAADAAQAAADSAQESADAANALAQQAKELADTVDAATKTLDAKIGDVETGLLEDVDEINRRLDGVVENYFEEGTPTLSSYPANEWTTDTDKKNHLGDTYTNIQEFVDEETTPDAGKSWRWTYTDSEHTGYHWHQIADSDAVKALLEASRAKAAADGKSRTFVAEPIPPYSVGDLWVQGDAGEIMKCIVERSSGAYVASDWAKASKYTDDTTAEEAKELAQQAKDAAEAAKEATDALDNDLTFTVVEKRSIRKALKDINSSQEDYTEPLRWEVSARAAVSGNAWTKVTDSNDANYGWYVSNMHTADSSSIVRITLQVNRKSDIEVSIMSRAESSFDYTLLSLIDTTLLASDTYSSSTRVATTTRNKQGQAVSHVFKDVSAGTHFFTVMYRKDSGGDTAPDNGYYRISDVEYDSGSLGDWMNIVAGKGLDDAICSPAVNAADSLFSYLYGYKVWTNENTEVPSGFRDEVYRLFQDYYKEVSAILVNTATSDLDYLANAMRNGKTITDGGLVMTSLVAVGDTEDVASADVEAFMNGSDFASDATHGKLMHALGIPTETSAGSTDLEERAKEAKTRMYEDGYTVTRTLELEEGCRIGILNVTEDGISAQDGCSDVTGGIREFANFTEGGFYVSKVYNTGSACAVIGSAQLTARGLYLSSSLSYDREFYAVDTRYFHVGFHALSCKAGLVVGSMTAVEEETMAAERDGKYSVYAREGVFAGLRPNTEKLTGGRTLTELDHTLVIASGTLYLPSAPMDGQHYRIVHTSTTSLTVRNSSTAMTNILKFKTDTSKIYTFSSTTKEIIDMTYCADDATWYVVFY